MQSSVSSLSGEFIAQTSEAEYRVEHLQEFVRQARICFFAAMLVNPLFLFSDWRFYGQANFFYVITSRAAVEIASLLCWIALARVRSFYRFELVCAVWAGLVIAAATALESSHTDLGLLIIFILSAIFYLALPVSFRLALACGVVGSVVMLVEYISSAPTSYGQMAGVAMINAALALALILTKRLRRLNWAATRAERAANERLAKSRDMWQQFLQAVPAPLLITAKEDGRLIRVNDAAADYFGVDASAGVFKVEDCFDRKDWARLTASLRSSGRASGFEVRIHLPNGDEKDVLLAATTVATDGVEVVVTILVDITIRKELEALMKRMAHTDPLTGMPNRARFFSLAVDEIKRAQRYDRPLSVCMIDIDFFKRINDTYGHKFGDRALKAFAGLCRKWIREQDTVARIGGEEFGLLLPETDEDSALALADRLRAAVEELQLDQPVKSITVSIGVSAILPGEESVDAALSRADEALYSAKREGRNRAVLYRDIEAVL